MPKDYDFSSKAPLSAEFLLWPYSVGALLGQVEQLSISFSSSKGAARDGDYQAALRWLQRDQLPKLRVLQFDGRNDIIVESMVLATKDLRRPLQHLDVTYSHTSSSSEAGLTHFAELVSLQSLSLPFATFFATLENSDALKTVEGISVLAEALPPQLRDLEHVYVNFHASNTSLEWKMRCHIFSALFWKATDRVVVDFLFEKIQAVGLNSLLCKDGESAVGPLYCGLYRSYNSPNLLTEKFRRLFAAGADPLGPIPYFDRSKGRVERMSAFHYAVAHADELAAQCFFDAVDWERLREQDLYDSTLRTPLHLFGSQRSWLRVYEELRNRFPRILLDRANSMERIPIVSVFEELAHLSIKVSPTPDSPLFRIAGLTTELLETQQEMFVQNGPSLWRAMLRAIPRFAKHFRTWNTGYDKLSSALLRVHTFLAKSTSSGFETLKSGQAVHSELEGIDDMAAAIKGALLWLPEQLSIEVCRAEKNATVLTKALDYLAIAYRGLPAYVLQGCIGSLVGLGGQIDGKTSAQGFLTASVLKWEPPGLRGSKEWKAAWKQYWQDFWFYVELGALPTKNGELVELFSLCKASPEAMVEGSSSGNIEALTEWLEELELFESLALLEAAIVEVGGE